MKTESRVKVCGLRASLEIGKIVEEGSGKYRGGYSGMLPQADTSLQTLGNIVIWVGLTPLSTVMRDPKAGFLFSPWLCRECRMNESK